MMSDVQTDLEALRSIQQDFAKIKELRQQINNVNNKIQAIDNECKAANKPSKPVLDNTESKRLQKEVEQMTTQNGGGYAAGVMFSLIAVAVIGLFTGSGFSKLWAVLGAGCAWLGGCFGLIPALIGCGLGVFIGWDAWANAGILWQIILAILAVTSVVIAHLNHRQDMKIKPLVEEKGREIYAQQQAEKAAFEEAMAEYERKLATLEEDCRVLSRKANKELYDEMDALREQLREVKERVAGNPILDDSDKTEEVIDFLISQLQRKRAVSLTDALQQYDAMVRQREKEMLEYENRKLQMDMERMWRDEQIRRESDAQWNQAMHNLRVEKEQRRQTEILEDINKSLEK